jgi:hypothetical protein
MKIKWLWKRQQVFIFPHRSSWDSGKAWWNALQWAQECWSLELSAQWHANLPCWVVKPYTGGRWNSSKSPDKHTEQKMSSLASGYRDVHGVHARAELGWVISFVLESDFSGCEVSRQARKCQHRRARQFKILWQLSLQSRTEWEVVWYAHCYVFGAGYLWSVFSWMQGDWVQRLLQWTWTPAAQIEMASHLMDTLLSKGDILLQSLHSSPLAHSLSLPNWRRGCLSLQKQKT